MSGGEWKEELSAKMTSASADTSVVFTGSSSMEALMPHSPCHMSFRESQNLILST